MAFTGKASYSGTFPDQLAQSMADVIGIISPVATPLLDALGDPAYSAISTKHEWLEDALNPDVDLISGAITAAITNMEVNNVAYFRVGDVIRVQNTDERILVLSISGSVLSVTRGYGSTTAADIADNTSLYIVGNAGLEGADAPTSKETNRTLAYNYAQLFTAGVKISGTEAAIRQKNISDEFDYQTSNRMKEQLLLLEKAVLHGVLPAATGQGSGTVGRTMKGIVSFITTNVTDDGGSITLTEALLNAALKTVCEAGGTPDIIVCGGTMKRKISTFISPTGRYYTASDDRFKAVVSAYESDWGIQRVVLAQSMQANEILMLTSSKIKVLPVIGRSFYMKPLAETGDYKHGELIGEYTLELMNEAAHGRIKRILTTG